MQTANCKVFIGGLSYSTTDKSLAAYFQAFGAVKEATVMRKPQGQSRGFGFCVFEDSQVCQNVLKCKNHIIDNRRVDVRLALSKNEAPPPQSSDGATKLNVNKIFVGGLHYQTSPDDLIQYFSTFGEVESGNVVYNHENHKSRGFGFVIFKNLSSVTKVMSISDHMIMGRKVEVKRAIPKEIEETSVLKSETGFSFSTSLTLNHESPTIKTIESLDFPSTKLDSSISTPKSTIAQNQSFPPVLNKPSDNSLPSFLPSFKQSHGASDFDPLPLPVNLPAFNSTEAQSSHSLLTPFSLNDMTSDSWNSDYFNTASTLYPSNTTVFPGNSLSYPHYQQSYNDSSYNALDSSIHLISLTGEFRSEPANLGSTNLFESSTMKSISNSTPSWTS